MPLEGEAQVYLECPCCAFLVCIHRGSVAEEWPESIPGANCAVYVLLHMGGSFAIADSVVSCRLCSLRLGHLNLREISAEHGTGENRKEDCYLSAD